MPVDSGDARGDKAKLYSSKPTRRHSVGDSIGYWLFSLAAVIVVPLIPVMIEARQHHGAVRDDSLLLTAAVLAATFGFTSESNIFRAAYTCLFIFGLVENFPIEADSGHASTAAVSRDAAPINPAASQTLQDGFGWIVSHGALAAVVAVAALHAIERFHWHVVQLRRFPDWLKD